ncbi:unnamed protein product [Anisakis simplex]|uniref:Uncharacterized protein n=1 Tax=Anisakis simplex TaxID=6269 RepID=A0A0M3JZ81_ANISI|nr:unnamed protein product [Anisakis simplex]
MVYEWSKESAESLAIDLMDEDRIVPIKEDQICESPPETGAETSIMQRSLCPWQWRLNHDNDRKPRILAEAYCLCRKSRGSSGALCMPIKRDVAVLRRIACDHPTATRTRYQFVRAVQTITVGCHSVLPRTQRAKPLNAFYRNAFSIEI